VRLPIGMPIRENGLQRAQRPLRTHRAGTHAEMVHTPGATSRIVSSVRPAAPDPWLPCSFTGFIVVQTGETVRV
jgi:hypothetical protein